MSPLLLLEESRKAALETTGDPRHLTSRELDVLELVAKGKTNNEIGEILQISPRTVSKHLENSYQKLGVENRTMAIIQLFWQAQSVAKQRFRR